MLYPQLNGDVNYIIIGISAVFGLLIVIIVYYIVVSKSSNPDRLYKNQLYTNTGNTGNTGNTKKTNNTSTQLPSPVNATGYYATAQITTPQSDSQSQSNTKRVFNIKENVYTLDDAAGVCGALDAEPATIEQLIDAHKQGADWCNVGWTKDGLAAFPIQYETWKTLQDNEPNKRNICGTPGINLVRNDPDLLYGVNCYGIKPDPKQNEKVKQFIQSDAQLALQLKIAQFQKNMNKIGIAPFNQNTW